MRSTGELVLSAVTANTRVPPISVSLTDVVDDTSPRMVAAVTSAEPPNLHAPNRKHMHDGVGGQAAHTHPLNSSLRMTSPAVTTTGLPDVSRLRVKDVVGVSPAGMALR